MKLTGRNVLTEVYFMGPWQLTVTWFKTRHAGEQAMHWDIQNKRLHPVKLEFCLFWMFQCSLRSKRFCGVLCSLTTRKLGQEQNKTEEGGGERR